MGAHLPVKYGDRFNGRIEAGVRAGKTLKAIAFRIGISETAVRRRAHEMNLSREVRENGEKARTRAKTGSRPSRPQSLVGIAALERHNGYGRRDPEVSRLAHRIRAAKVPLSRHAIAALHERGLTLDELHQATGRPVNALVGFIREAAR